MSVIPRMFKVYYLVGGYTNMVCKELFHKYTEEDANKEILELNKMGYPAQKTEYKGQPLIGWFVCSSDCDSEEEMKKYYELAHVLGFSPINQIYNF